MNRSVFRKSGLAGARMAGFNQSVPTEAARKQTCAKSEKG